MTPKQYYKTRDRETIEELCKKAKTTFGNFQQIAIAKGSVSTGLAERLSRASGGIMTEMEILYPERFEPSETGSAA